MIYLTRDESAKRAEISYRTFIRDEQRGHITAAKRQGCQLLFDPRDVDALKARRDKKLKHANGNGNGDSNGIVTMKELRAARAKRKAGAK